MADGITLNPGSDGPVVATDDDGSFHWQYVKLAFGADNVYSKVESISSNPLPVALSSTDNGVLDQIDSNTDYGAVTGGGTETGALRVTIANNSTGVISIDDGGNTITVDGTVNVATVGDTVAISHSALTELAGAIDTQMQCDIVDALPAGDNNIGNVDIVSIGSGTNTIGGVIAQTSSSTAYDGTTSCTIKRFNVIATTTGDTIITAPTGTKKILVRSMAIIAMSSTISEIYFETGTTGTDTLGDSTNGFQIGLDVDGNNIGGLNLGFNPDGWFKTADADESLEIVMSSNQPMLVVGTYIEVS